MSSNDASNRAVRRPLKGSGFPRRRNNDLDPSCLPCWFPCRNRSGLVKIDGLRCPPIGPHMLLQYPFYLHELSEEEVTSRWNTQDDFGHVGVAPAICGCSQSPTTLGTRQYAVPHNFERYNLIFPRRCNGCTAFVWSDNENLRCTTCEIIIHDVPECVNRSPIICLPHVRVSARLAPHRLEAYCPRFTLRIPGIVARCIFELERCHKAQAAHIYNTPVSTKLVKKLVRGLHRNVNRDLSGHSAHVIANVLKYFLLYYLEEPLIPLNLFDAFRDVCFHEELPGRFDADPVATSREIGLELRRLILDELPVCNRTTLACVMHHLQYILRHSGRNLINNNQMTTEQLARIFSTSIVGLRGEEGVDWMIAVQITQFLLCFRPDFWDAILMRDDRAYTFV